MKRENKALRKIVFWLMLGALSVFFAEVVTGSYMIPLFTLWGLLVIFPLYTFHILVFSYISLKNRKGSLAILILCGMLFGMYEAYITKVLWSPAWGEAILKIGGIAIIETVVLVPGLHTFMSFIIPLMIAEMFFTNSSKVLGCMPEKVRGAVLKKGYLLLILGAMILGLLQGWASPVPAYSLSSGLSIGLFFAFLVFLYNKNAKKKVGIEELLPGKKTFHAILFILIISYIVLGITIRPEAIPSFGPQVPIIILYGVLLFLLYTNLRKPERKEQIIQLNPEFSWKNYSFFILVFSISSALWSLVPFKSLSLVTAWFVWFALGFYSVIYVIKESFKRIT